MTHLKLEELVSYFVLAQPDSSKPLSEVDFVRLIEDMGLEAANEHRQAIVEQLREGHNIHVVVAIVAA
ncbi:hypothetical protein E7T06_09505 [Deinococcus sp. Arct2-2]|uniref:hypothetical protein n=1 Tax=Deinococcus sp. Arct2-2 TaxID=2568653 RepID=UPI0010A3CEEA|nr:hypothetical protein [Deinococcus sp. Arct2-2]THF69981.1 hypothetical protein E7T06_09505 [Deinococcus sp. Arct2-2]